LEFEPGIKTKEDLLKKWNEGWNGLYKAVDSITENYAVVSYKIELLNDANCNLTWHQQGFSSEEGKCHTEQALESMLKKIKELAEE